jgi:EAL and modified HD-GYP domain-containing signal transduction protein
MQDYYIGRQPIFDQGQRVIGYELLYRQNHGPWTNIVDGDQATSQIIVNSFWELGLGKVVGPHRAFVNVTRGFLLNSEWLPPPSDQLVLEILEDTLIDEAVMAAVRELKRKGYMIALDDFTYRPGLDVLLGLADYIKLDVLALDNAQLEEHLHHLDRYSSKLVAEKVETPEMFDRCRGLGFQYYQGYFLCRPRVISGKRLSTSRLTAMRMMAQLQSSQLDLTGLEELISHDPTLTYKLLRYINSAAFAVAKKIQSIHHAVVYLGEREIRRWASLITLTGIDDKPDALFTTSLVRARMCELLSDVMKAGDKDSAFMVGLFSILDAMMDQPIETVLESLPLSSEILDALLRRTGPYGQPLEITVAYERADWDAIDRHAVSQPAIATIYLQALDWADATSRTVSSAA